MARQRLLTAFAYHGLTGRGWKLSRLLVPRSEREKLVTGLEGILNPDLLPRQWDDADVYPFSRDGDGNKLGINDSIHADWIVGDVTVAAYRSLHGTGICARFRWPRSRGLAIHHRPPPRDEEKFAPGYKVFDQWHFLEPRELSAILANVLALPEGARVELVDGISHVCEDITLFRGEIAVRSQDPAIPVPPPWSNKIHLFVTDSDPQYFCLCFSSDPKRPPPRPAP